jgi:hypothetical protein
MATQQIVSSVAPQQKSPLPFTAPAKPITQLDLETFILARNSLAKAKEQFEIAETDLTTRLQAGAPVQEGVHVATLKPTSRRNVSWKDVVVRLAERLKMDGEAYCAKVLSATKPTPGISLDVR